MGMISFEPSEEQTIMCDAVAQFAKASLLDHVRQFETSGAVSDHVREAAHEMCLGTIALPADCGGQELGLLTQVLLEEEIARVDAGSAFGLPGPGPFGFAVTELGDEAQRIEQLQPFSEPSAANMFGAVAFSEPAPNRERAGFVCVAREEGDGYTLEGAKCYVGNAGLADRFVVFAQVDEAAGWDGIGAFVVSRDNPGLTVGERHATLGLNAACFGTITLKGAKVAEKARLLGGDDFTLACLRYFTKQSLVVAARAVGMSHCAFELAREYCDTRNAFGKPIGHFQAVAFNLADRLMDVESARWLVWKAAWCWDEGKDVKECLQASAQAAAHALEAAMRCGDDCASLHGGAGFVRDVLAEKMMRDAKQLAFCCPTAEQLDQLATAIDVGAPLDADLVLPTPDLQAIFT